MDKKGMYCMNKQSGKSRVNKVVEGKKYKRKKTQAKQHKQLTPFEKIKSIQKGLLMKGMGLDEYIKYVQDKINKEKYYYKQLTNDNVEQLHQSFEKLIKKDNNQFNLKEDILEMKRKQRKNFRKQRKEKMDNYKGKLIEGLMIELPSGKGVIKNTSHLSTDPTKWNETKNYLFPGGCYIEDSDRKWTSIYGKLTSLNSHCIFDVVYGSDKLQELYLNP
jgi:hypothetical protein